MKSKYFWILLVLSSCTYIGLGYFTDRSNFISLFSQVGILFILFFFFWKILNKKNSEISISTVQWAGIFLRLLLLFNLPNLSDDYFRFLWDGQLTIKGINPYLNIPEAFLALGDVSEYQMTLYEGLNSKPYFSVYPPLNQLIFSISVFIFPKSIPGSIVVMKVILLLAEAISIFTLPIFLNKFKLNQNLSMFYILNPLIIIEGIGNLHFEVFTVLFLILAFVYLYENRFILSAIFFGLAISIKLIPLIMIPVLSRYLGVKKFIQYAFLSIGIFLIGFIPFYDPLVLKNIMSSVELYFQSFEFNASIYYVVRYFGFLLKGYNIIHVAGIILSILVLVISIMLSLKVKRGDATKLFQVIFYSLLSYYLFTTTMHPWYLINLILFSLFTIHSKSVFLWSFLIFLSYSAYNQPEVSEKYWFIALEYVIFSLALFFEIYSSRKTNKINV